MKRRWLVLSPHPDDEVLGCGGLLALEAAADSEITVIVISDGGAGLAPHTTVSDRQQESRAGLAALGVETVEFWDYRDGAIPIDGEIAQRYRAAIERWQPDCLLLPATSEAHDDHRRVCRGVLNALTGVWQGELWFYETIQPNPTVNRHLDISAVYPKKLAALQCHHSQLGFYDYSGHIDALSRLRGVACGAARAEAYLNFLWDGSPQRFFENRPLISVVVRARDPQFLVNALASLQNQTYDQLEVVLVWFGEGEPDLSGFGLLACRVIAGKPSRSHNLNLGVAAARGEYIAFLDEDDVVYPDHYAALLGELHSESGLDLVYAGCRVRRCRREADGSVSPAESLGEKNLPFSAERLRLGNFIPLHALLCRTAVLRRYRFDESLEAYEDWDLLARLVDDRLRFGHLDLIGCEYRLYGEEGQDEAALHQAKGYAPWEEVVRSRIAERLDGAGLKGLRDWINRLEGELGAMRQGAARLVQELEQTQQALQQAERNQRQIAATAAALGWFDGADELPLRCAAAALARRGPRFSVILPVCDTPPHYLAEALQSLANQYYDNWQLCLIDDGSTRTDTWAVVENWLADPRQASRTRWRRRSERGGIVAASNDGLDLVQGDWVAYLDHDDRLSPQAFLEMALALAAQPQARLVYTDSRTIDANGAVLNIYHKPDWSPELVLSMNYLNHLTVVEAALLRELGGLRQAFHGSQDFDLILRLAARLNSEQVVHIERPCYDWRAAPGSVAYAMSAKPWAQAAAVSALEAHFAARGLTAQAGWQADYPGVYAEWSVDWQPIRVVIPTHRHLTGLQRCLNGLCHGTDYPALHITVVANRAEPALRAWLDHFAGSEPRLQVIDDDRPFNWSAINNRAVSHSEEPWILWLNDDIEMLEPNWLKHMARWLALDAVGAVGATLSFPDGGLQHNGIVTSTDFIASNIDEWGSRRELAASRNVSAVTGACMLVRRSAWEDAGGFDEQLAVSYNDVDHCLALRAMGWRVVQAVDAKLIHAESSTRGRTAEDDPQWRAEIVYMRDKWGEALRERYHSRYEVLMQTTRVLPVEEQAP
ncbi:glycosyltransferase [Chitinimonas lacunae]|uniref:Glycosyltransferase n=1 Tax=Chitinimonas lacunae TaxID=1963018 RepID=A0ABV8MVW6_9NEIS